MMAERSILFSAPMVRAILDGRKTMTRRALNWQGVKSFKRHSAITWSFTPFVLDAPMKTSIPKYQVGDTLWVREAWGINDYRYGGKHPIPKARPDDLDDDHMVYGATETDAEINNEMPLRPSIHMPRWACRLTLPVTAVKVERLQDISEEDAKAEGIEKDHAEGIPGIWGWHDYMRGNAIAKQHFSDPRKSFETLWASINGPGSWDENPWVVAVSFTPTPPVTGGRKP